MKKLLNKTLKVFTIYALIVLAASVPAYYYLVDSIWLAELDENNEIIANRTEKELNRLQLSDTELAQSIYLWNKVQPGTNLQPTNAVKIHEDSIYTISRRNPYVTIKDIDRFRGLSRVIRINDKNYRLSVETNVEETEETVLAIAVITFVFFLILVIGFLLLNRRLSVRLWKPFRNTLSKLRTFSLNHQTAIEFEKSDTFEFEELNAALSKLIDRNISTYKMQKEFTENASHELQTPLAIIKNKLDLLLQQHSLTDRQYEIIEEINKALTRISRINKNLLLLAKIENGQFANSEQIVLDVLIIHCFEQIKEHADHKMLTVKFEMGQDTMINGNKTLVELLINNLLLNAIRHSTQHGTIIVTLLNGQLLVANSGTKALNTETMFHRFVKVSDQKSGSGLGLAIVREICKHHQWELDYHFSENFHSFSIRF